MTLLLAWAWQGLVLALAVHLALRVLHRLDAATRHALWWGTLGAVMLLPLVLALPWPWPGGAALSPGGLALDEPAAPGYLLTVPAPPAAALHALMSVWLALTAVRLGRLAYGWWTMRRMVHGSAPFDAALEGRLGHVARVRRTGPPVTLRLSEAVRVPCAVGLGHAVVLVPPSLAGTLEAPDLDRIVLHEYAHLMRRDDRWRLAQALLEAPFGLHPAVAWIGRQIELEREAARDDLVVALAGGRQRYAGALVETAWHARQAGLRASGPLPLAPAATRTGRLLRTRVERLLDASRPRRLQPAAASLAAGFLLLAAAALALGSVSPPVGVAARQVRAAAATASPPRLPARSSPGNIHEVAERPITTDEHQAPNRSGRGRPGAASVAARAVHVPRAASQSEPDPAAGRSVPTLAAPEEPAEGDPALPVVAALASSAPSAAWTPTGVHADVPRTGASPGASTVREHRPAGSGPPPGLGLREPPHDAWQPALPEEDHAAPTALRPSSIARSIRRGEDGESVAARLPEPEEVEAAPLKAIGSGEVEGVPVTGAGLPPARPADSIRPAWTALVEAGRALDAGFTRTASTLARRFGRLGEAAARAY